MTLVDADFSRSGRVPQSREEVFGMVTDPRSVARLLPKIDTIVADGDVWSWTLVPINALGFTFVPAFEVTVAQRPPERIDFVPAGETAAQGVGATGAFVLGGARGGGTDLGLHISLTLELAIPRMLRRAARRVMLNELDEAAGDFFANVRRAR